MNLEIAVVREHFDLSRQGQCDPASSADAAVIGIIRSYACTTGSPHYDGEAVAHIYDFACAEAQRYREGGVDGLIVENHGDIPFAKPDELGPETAACMAVMADRVRRESGLPIGINVLANGAVQGLAVAKAAGAVFVRVNQWANAYVANEGFIEGEARAARGLQQLAARGRGECRRCPCQDAAHAVVADRTLQESDTGQEFFDADAVMAPTGTRRQRQAGRTRSRCRRDQAAQHWSAVALTPDNVASIFQFADARSSPALQT